MLSTLTSIAAGEPAGGAPVQDLVPAALVAGLLTAAALAVAAGHRRGRVTALTRLAALAERIIPCPAGRRCPCWSRLARSGSRRSASSGTSPRTSTPAATAGPFANVAHYPILARPRRHRAGGLPRLLCSVPTRATAQRSRWRAGLADPARRRAAAALRRGRDARLPARRRLAPDLRPGRDAVGPDARADDRRRLAGADRRLAAARRGPPRRPAARGRAGRGCSRGRSSSRARR